MDESMEIKVAQMIKFDVEDMLPVEYQHRIREEKQPDECSLLLDNDLCDSFSRSNISELDRTKNTSKMDPQEWIKAPVFIPRQTIPTLLPSPATNGYANPFEVTPPVSFFQDKHILPNFSSIPPGSTANYLTSIDPSQVRAPPSTTIILRKKRRLSAPKRFANRRLTLGHPFFESMVGAGAEDAKNQGFLRLESPIVRTSVNILDYKTMWSSAINRYSPRRECRSPSLPDVFNGQVKNTASETELNQMKDPTLYTTTNRETNPNLFSLESANLDSSSCPDLSDNQLRLWDDILNSAVQHQKDMHKLLDNNSNIVRDQPYEEETEMDSAAFHKMTASTVMNTSVYELCPPAVFDALDVAVHADGISTEELRRLDKTMAGCSLEDSFNQNSMVERLQQLPTDKMNMYSNPAYVSLATTLASEMPELNRQHNIVDDSDSGEDVIFKPQISVNLIITKNVIKKTFIAANPPELWIPAAEQCKGIHDNFDPKDKKTMSGMDPMSKCSNPTDVNQELEQLDCYEGMRIQVNAFGECDDVALSEAECPTPSRFRELQWALQRHKNQYFETKQQNGVMGVDQPPQRVCCQIM